MSYAAIHPDWEKPRSNMVDGYSLVIGLMATALIASAVSRMVSKPLYATLAEHMIRQQSPADSK